MSVRSPEDDPGSLGPFLSLIEKHGDVVVSARSLESAVSLDARVALRAAGVLVGAEAAASWPCDVRGCAREIRSNYDGARRPIVAVCCQVPAACAPVELGFDDVSQQRISVEAFVRVACELLGATVDAALIGAVSARHPVGGARAPVLVATSARPARDLFWAGTPRDTDLAAFCARRERVARRTLVLVPTARHVPLDVAARFARGEQVEVLCLADALEVREGALAQLTPEAARAPDAPARPEPAPLADGSAAGLAARLGVTRWEDVRILVVDDRTVRIEARGHRVLRTFVELGFVDGRKPADLSPVTAWSVLLLLCHKGVLRPSEYQQFGKRWAVKKGIEEMRRRLCAGFGLEGDPLLTYLSRDGWRPRFRVNAAGA